MTSVERIVDTNDRTGEGPLWHPDEYLLYWVDIPAGRLYQYDPVDGQHGLAYETQNGAPIGGFTIEADGALLLFEDEGRIKRWSPGSSETELVTRIDADTRFNDVVADPRGRVFCGTMPSENQMGDLYRLEKDGTATIVVEDVNIPNGMGFSCDSKTFYFTESEAHRIYAFDYDSDTGSISNQRTFIETTTDDGVPDGMTVDAEDHIWTALWNGNRAVRYDPSGKLVDEISLPARKVSSVIFGGEEYNDLYLTTAHTGNSREQEGQGAGALFRISNLETGGTPEWHSQIATK
ncbi:SMP-30/gluconolactonase/LRE family protein [Halomontanus rarus]|uniref:SMP-30/gluconolactonase/LRE family protein n=1 Tax=Halomontanus rarus TaxID=3034020 RepID=UPI0023E7B25B|nr:SMP-30/gluconolactonase/LRE family protein [Halovivax sp. TS33]